jgi:hypothetical protein
MAPADLIAEIRHRDQDVHKALVCPPLSLHQKALRVGKHLIPYLDKKEEVKKKTQPIFFTNSLSKTLPFNPLF